MVLTGNYVATEIETNCICTQTVRVRVREKERRRYRETEREKKKRNVCCVSVCLITICRCCAMINYLWNVATIYRVVVFYVCRLFSGSKVLLHHCECAPRVHKLRPENHHRLYIYMCVYATKKRETKHKAH